MKTIKIMGVIMVVVMGSSWLSSNALANAMPFEKISNCRELQQIKPEGHYIITQDIDCTGIDFHTIPYFKGVLTGLTEEATSVNPKIALQSGSIKKPFVINNLNIKSEKNDAAIFGTLAGADLSYLRFNNVQVTSNTHNTAALAFNACGAEVSAKTFNGITRADNGKPVNPNYIFSNLVQQGYVLIGNVKKNDFEQSTDLDGYGGIFYDALLGAGYLSEVAANNVSGIEASIHIFPDKDLRTNIEAVLNRFSDPVIKSRSEEYARRIAVILKAANKALIPSHTGDVKGCLIANQDAVSFLQNAFDPNIALTNQAVLNKLKFKFTTVNNLSINGILSANGGWIGGLIHNVWPNIVIQGVYTNFYLAGNPKGASGFVSNNLGEIDISHAHSIDQTHNADVAAFAGENGGNINNSYATGFVAYGNCLTKDNYGTITTSFTNVMNVKSPVEAGLMEYDDKIHALGFGFYQAAVDSYWNSSNCHGTANYFVNQRSMVDGKQIVNPSIFVNFDKTIWQKNSNDIPRLKGEDKLPLVLTLYISGQGTGSISLPTFSCSKSNTKTATCVGTIIKNQPVKLSFTGIDTKVVNWGINYCAPSNSECTLKGASQDTAIWISLKKVVGSANK